VIEFIDSHALFINRKLGITDYVDKQNMGDLQLDLFLKLSGHLGSHGNARHDILEPAAESRAQSAYSFSRS
jgi:hypothetical protein